MADPDFVWNPTELLQQVQNGEARNLKEAADLLYRETRQAVSRRGAPIIGKTRKNLKSTTGRRIQLREPSKPGEPPHKFTGALFRGIKKKLMTKKGRARITSIGGGTSEFGTSKEAARPFLRPTLAKLRSRIASILTKPVN